MKRLKFGLATQIFLGLILGVAAGAIWFGNPAVATYLQPVGDLFLRLIKMIVIPIVVSSLIVGVAGAGSGKKVGRLGFRTILYFEIITTFAIVLGLLLGNIVQPGHGVNFSGAEKQDISQYVETEKEASTKSVADTFLHIVPTNFFQSLAEGDLLAIICFTVLFALGVSAIGEKGKPVLSFFEATSQAMFHVVNIVMKFAPFGVFALIGVTVSKFGFSSLLSLGKLVLLVYLALAFFLIVIFGIVGKLCGINIFKFLAYMKDELLLAYSTSSSETVLPRVMEKMEKIGCPKGIVSFVIPIGYTFNLDGSVLYQAIAALFLAQVYGIDLSIGQQLTLILVLMVTSKGMAAVPGTSFVVLLATLGTIGVPAEGLAFIAGVDRIMDMARTVVNLTGNALAAVVMSKWEGEYDAVKGQTVLNQREPADMKMSG
ncbi:cation:dicarboxylase symporter family transporter [Bacillus paralicheniformis]|uniref:cation:dicarboxylate symporter family transporter n=1 Tax=Bacillus paralicheniformis TaxID=1648923 RepID=UPI000652D55A|nr:cation:dicarboxylase symporter family transporter [Bacillus paralicheniformis]KND06066.1 glutamate:protein symporter [Bacillus paralicheniformis]KRT89677.1 glutamate:protein symporter [Bacillus paralicheniformis]MCM3425320.1 cation:dicarboxylase symporter family transporter [Bacillus paralicheniformis]MEB3129798.1 cation:dicarboxylase symporter family transporter [Bacillus paralicheniformis]MED1149175.1 cation:dicarboxylase symporter family transporter [Bacillus paralicheniformis]